jgi:hypothetical protein
MRKLAVEGIVVRDDVGAVEARYEPACKKEIGPT